MVKSAKLVFLCLGVLISKPLFGADAPKTAVLVVGVARSGTSCVSGVLNILGVNFGDNFHPNSASIHNQKGDFEDLAFNKFLREMCQELQLTPRDPRIIDWDKEPNRKRYKNEIKRFIANYKNESFGLKLPFLSLLLPVFLDALVELNYTPKIVVVLRNPHEIRASWQARWNTPTETVYGAIATYYFNILKYAQAYDVLTIDFKDVIADTERVVARINEFIPGPRSYAQVKKEIFNFIDAELKHHNEG